jgi:hypothetical protein
MASWMPTLSERRERMEGGREGGRGVKMEMEMDTRDGGCERNGWG